MSVKEILISRDGMSGMEADEYIDQFKIDLLYQESLMDAEELLKDYFGLEPDYLEEFI